MSSMSEFLFSIAKKRYQLSEEEYAETLSDIIEDFTYGIDPVSNPSVIILGAQPGAGKTELQKEAEYRLLKNAVICNADNLRDYHPKAQEIKKQFPEQYPEVTAIYAQSWNDSLCRYCEDKKLNYILETTFSSGDRLAETIKNIREKGFNVDIMLLAVDPRLSLLGTHLRYEHSVATTGVGRQVSKQAHDIRFAAIPKTIKSINTPVHYNNLYLYARSIVLQHTDLVEGISLVAHNPVNLQKAYQEEISRKWPEKLTEYFNRKCEYVTELMERRKALNTELYAFRENMGISGDNPSKQRRRRLGL